MATELGLLSQNLQKLAQQQKHQLNMWSCHASHRRPTVDDGDSWEVRAFAEDISSAAGTTWPPRSYTCTFCRREFRSAQALGGHMNVHRRDRARLQQLPQGSNPNSHSSVVVAASSTPVAIPSPEFIANGGLCLFYPAVPHPGAVSTSASADSTTPCSAWANFQEPSPHAGVPLLDKLGMMGNINIKGHNGYVSTLSSSGDGVVVEEMDLELRLGW